MLGAVTSGRYTNLHEAAAAMVHDKETIAPNPERHEEYKFWVDQYIKIHPAMRDLQHDVADHLAQQQANEND